MSENQDFSAYLGITENRSKIMAVIVSMVRDFDLAEDLFQQTVLEILRGAEKFDAARDFLPWASGVARNVVRRHWRAAARRPALASQEWLDKLAGLAVEEQDEDVWQAERAALQVCLNKLPEKMQRLFLLRYGQNCKAEELARLRLKMRHCINMEIQEAS